MRGVFLDAITVDWDDLDFSGLASTLPQWDFFPTTSPEQCESHIADAQIVVTNKVKFSREVIEKAKNLQCICVAATGYDLIDVEYAKSRGIVVCNVVDYSTPSVVQHTIGLIINLASRIVDYAEAVREGEWINSPLYCLKSYPTQTLQNKVLGIIGYGAIGSGVAKVAEALGMQIKTRIPLPELLAQVDYLTLHCPLTPNTREMINENTIAMMKKGACIINTARGGLINETALINALVSGHLGGAAVDVLSQEPPSTNHPFMQSIPNLIITPHVAWATRESRQALLVQLEQNVRAFLAGNPIHVIN
jgi:glycerate dehydrogenase